jgi:hypothetical protein
MKIQNKEKVRNLRMELGILIIRRNEKRTKKRIPIIRKEIKEKKSRKRKIEKEIL